MKAWGRCGMRLERGWKMRVTRKSINSVACLFEGYHSYAGKYYYCLHRFETSVGYWGGFWMQIDFRASASFLGKRGASWRPLPFRRNQALRLLEISYSKAPGHAAYLALGNPVLLFPERPSPLRFLSDWRPCLLHLKPCLRTRQWQIPDFGQAVTALSMWQLRLARQNLPTDVSRLLLSVAP